MTMVTPPKPLSDAYIHPSAETPAPYRARLNNYDGQIKKLVKEKAQDKRKHQAEISEKDREITELLISAKDATFWRKLAQDKTDELKALKEAGESMREELNMFSVIAQERALLALAEEQLRMVEMEQRLLQARAASLMRDHKIALFKAKEDDLVAELAEKDAQLQELEAALEEANTSLAHQQAAEAKTSRLAASTNQTNQKELDDALRRVETYENKVNGLETKLASSKNREKELAAELEAALKENTTGASDDEKRELQKALRAATSDSAKRQEEVTELKEDLAALKQSSKEREEKLKAKAKEAMVERDRLADVEAELDALRSAKSSPKKAEKKPAKARKAPSSDESEAEEPKKKKKESPKKKARANDSDSDVPYKPEKVMAKSNKINQPTAAAPKVKAVEVEKVTVVKTKNKPVEEEVEKPVPEKKKKRRLLGAEPAFKWDPILSSGDGVIPSYLSPARPAGGSVPVVPRAGFGAGASRGVSRFQR